jgi:lysyl-tRNA synthetase, class II
MSLDDLRQDRIKKYNTLKESGVDPFPISSGATTTLAKMREGFSLFLESKEEHVLCGRVIRKREQGGLIFFHIFDGTDKMQGMIKKDSIGDDSFAKFVDLVDIGDFIQCRGVAFETKRGEQTLLLSNWDFLSKSIRPLPDKWHGLQDVEMRLRKRYLDFLMSDDARRIVEFRSKLIREIRKFLDAEDYLEVETPALQPLYGGGNAEPFLTHHNALDEELYLRISNELYLKRLLVAGFPKVYEIYKGFRNEGIDATHYPEFTMLEFYEAYTDAKGQMERTEILLRTCIDKLLESTAVSFGGHSIDFGKKFEVLSYGDVLKREADIDISNSLTREEWQENAQSLGISVNNDLGEMKIMDTIFKKICKPKIIQPTFLVEYPIEYLPLAKAKEDNPIFADAFQLVSGGIELVKGYSELNDSLVQRERFEKQESMRLSGEKDAQPWTSHS